MNSLIVMDRGYGTGYGWPAQGKVEFIPNNLYFAQLWFYMSKQPREAVSLKHDGPTGQTTGLADWQLQCC